MNMNMKKKFPACGTTRSLTAIGIGLLMLSCGKNTHYFDATGAFEATEVTVSAEVTGKILAFDVNEGREMVAGECVGLIDTVQLSLTKRQLEHNRAAIMSNRPDIRKQMAAIRQQIAAQQAEQARLTRLLAAEAATGKQLDDVVSATTVLERQLDALQSSLQNSAASVDEQSEAIELQIAQVDDRLAKCVISSPISGITLAKYAEAGELAVTGRPLFKVADTKRLFLRAYLVLPQLKDVKIGQNVKVFADFGGEHRREYDGRITWISEKSEFTPKNIQTKDDREHLVYAVKVAIENDGYVKIGMYGELVFSSQ